MIKYCCRRGKCVEVQHSMSSTCTNIKVDSLVGCDVDEGHVIAYKPDEGVQLFPECKDCGYGRFYTDYKKGHFIDRAWKTCLLRRIR